MSKVKILILSFDQPHLITPEFVKDWSVTQFSLDNRNFLTIVDAKNINTKKIAVYNKIWVEKIQLMGDKFEYKFETPDAKQRLLDKMHIDIATLNPRYRKGSQPYLPPDLINEITKFVAGGGRKRHFQNKR
jgi:hypothetical protein